MNTAVDAILAQWTQVLHAYYLGLSIGLTLGYTLGATISYWILRQR